MKILVVYYSYQGNTKSIVDMINKNSFGIPTEIFKV